MIVMKKISIVLIIVVGNFVNLYYMGQNVEKESEQDLTVANFENVQSENSIIEEKQEVLNIVDINEAKEIEKNSIIEDKVNNIKQENSDTPSKEKTIEFWVNSLNARKFNRDNETLKEFDDKIKESIKRYTVKVQKLFKEIEDYLKR